MYAGYSNNIIIIILKFKQTSSNTLHDYQCIPQFTRSRRHTYDKRKNNGACSRRKRRNTSEACKQPSPAVVNMLRSVVIKRSVAKLIFQFFDPGTASTSRDRSGDPCRSNIFARYIRERMLSTPVLFVIATTSPCDELHRFVVVPTCRFHCSNKSKRSRPTQACFPIYAKQRTII